MLDPKEAETDRGGYRERVEESTAAGGGYQRKLLVHSLHCETVRLLGHISVIVLSSAQLSVCSLQPGSHEFSGLAGQE